MMGTGNREKPGLVSDLKELTDGGRQIVQHSVLTCFNGGHTGTGGA